jgi:hypothetical protein
VTAINLLADQSVRVIENFGRLEYADHTLVHPVGLVMLLACCIALLCVPRRFAIIPFLVMALVIPSAQRIVVGSLDFTFLRILIVVGLLRVMLRGEQRGVIWWRLDAIVVVWAAALFAASMIRTGGEVLEYQCGMTMETLGGYFLLRVLIRDWSDIKIISGTAVTMSVPLALAFVYEQATQYNMFSVFGGVNATTVIRDERLRCMGPYNHPILAGCIWAALVPLCLGLLDGGLVARVAAVCGAACGSIIVYCCASSTPVFGVVAVAVGVVAFLLRPHMRWVRWCTLASLVGLHLVMKAPVWHLISRVSAVGGSTSYFRFLLIDNFITRSPEWALTGTDDTANWFWGGQDVTNFFVMQGVSGGLATFVAFVGIVSFAFAGVGRAVAHARADRSKAMLAWCVGVSLFVHCANFLGVSYFGQSTLLWFMTVAMAGTLGTLVPDRLSAPVKPRVRFVRQTNPSPSGALC